MRDPNESESERLNRNFADLLQELRVAQTGVQILFAFLLTLAFSARFDAIDGFEQAVYLVSLLAAAAAAGLLIAPVAYHRAVFRRGQKPALVHAAHRMAVGGLAFLLVAMVGSVLLVTDLMLPRGWALTIAATMAACFVLLWGILPLVRRAGLDRQDELPSSNVGA